MGKTSDAFLYSILLTFGCDFLWLFLCNKIRFAVCVCVCVCVTAAKVGGYRILSWYIYGGIVVVCGCGVQTTKKKNMNDEKKKEERKGRER